MASIVKKSLASGTLRFIAANLNFLNPYPISTPDFFYSEYNPNIFYSVWKLKFILLWIKGWFFLLWIYSRNFY